MFSKVAISLETVFRMCRIIDNLKLAVLVVKAIVSLHVSVRVSFFISELPVMSVNKDKTMVIHLGYRVDPSVSSFHTISDNGMNTSLPFGGMNFSIINLWLKYTASCSDYVVSNGENSRIMK